MKRFLLILLVCVLPLGVIAEGTEAWLSHRCARLCAAASGQCLCGGVCQRGEDACPRGQTCPGGRNRQPMQRPGGRENGCGRRGR